MFGGFSIGWSAGFDVADGESSSSSSSSGGAGVYTYVLSCCCGCDQCFVAIYIGNENQITDDDYQLSLDGDAIATITETDTVCGPLGDCRGHLVLPASLTGWEPNIVGIAGTGYTCEGVDISLTYSYSAALDNLPAGTHTIRLLSVGDNACGNFGRLAVFCVKNPTGDSADASIQDIILESTYDSTDVNRSFDSTCPDSESSSPPGT